MLNETMIEQRLSALESAVVDLQRQAAAAPTHANWLDKFIGSVSDLEAFEEALEYGRAFRQSDRPLDQLGATS